MDENGSLLDVIDNKKQSNDGTTSAMASTTNTNDRKLIRRRSHPNQRIGHSAFNVVNLHVDQGVFVKSESPKDGATQSATNATGDVQIVSGDSAQCGGSGNASAGDASQPVKKETDGIDVADSNAVPNNTMKIQIKDEPIDDTNTSNVDEQSIQHVRQQIVPVIKTEIGNNVPVISNTAIQRPITIQQSAQLQQQPHQQTFATNDQTLILSSRPIRRLTTNGPADGKSGKYTIHALCHRFRFHQHKF